MSFTFGGYPTYCPGQELRNSADAAQAAHLPVHWSGNPNHFKLTRGCRPGTGTLLMRRGDIDQLLGVGAADGYVIGSGTQDDYKPLRIFGQSGENDRTFNKIIVCGHCECISPGSRADPQSIYTVPIADRRWLLWHHGEPIEKSYNRRSDTDGTYVSVSLNAGVAWTWQQMLADIWPSAAGTCPTLPFTPHGTPEGFWYANVYRFRAVQHILDRLACDLYYNPVTDTFLIVRLGDEADAGEIVWRNLVIPTYAKDRIWDDNAQRPFSVVRPDNVRVRFRVKIPYDDHDLPWYVKDTAIAPSTGPVGVGSHIALQDDAYALSANGTHSITNDSYLAARALERTNDYARVADKCDRDDYRSYSKTIIDNALDSIGATISAVTWEDRAPTDRRPGGMATSFYSGIGAAKVIEDWAREELFECCTDGGSAGGGGGIVNQCQVAPPPFCPLCLDVIVVDAFGTQTTGILLPGPSIGGCNYSGTIGEVSIDISIGIDGIHTYVQQSSGPDYIQAHYSACASWDATSPVNIGSLRDSRGNLTPPRIVSALPSANCPPPIGGGVGGGTGGGGVGGGGIVPCIPCDPNIDFPCYKCANGQFCKNWQACFSKQSPGSPSPGGFKSLSSPFGGPGLGTATSRPVMSSDNTGCGCGGSCGGNCGCKIMPAMVFGGPFGGRPLGGYVPLPNATQQLDIEALGLSARSVLVGTAAGAVAKVNLNDGEVLGAVAGALVSVPISASPTLPSYTVATLPTPSLGLMVTVTDYNGLVTWGGPPGAGGGAGKVAMWYNGTGWTIFGT